MRRIIKGIEPAPFIEWKARANEDWKPAYPTLQNPQKRELHDDLLHEQNFSCCYYGREIDLDNSHIGHFRPQEGYLLLALEYSNLHTSCLRKTKLGNPLHCGHYKSNWFDESLHISPYGRKLRATVPLSADRKNSKLSRKSSRRNNDRKACTRHCLPDKTTLGSHHRFF
ncbi:hypothetical protein ALP73_101701 [Pseudomonas coronafaciens pv. garcae]|uniref:Uncharacterized protein n=1 Tax=Pseudomonas coronafaciens pv. garcae TaxID=251653 RepID=A0AB37QTA8_9PSED|nr:hypothetical protein ALQ25_101780 [Pseudomonas coronafaciens pv. atropurpurea]RMS00168.1 hypothetical protein ALP73_101701 [Pseudomonas coronafaciens pv. garcae]RMS04240.1 hypothetical protein ALP74_101610 [Pseudomonas coronafaciens pv. garcae]RMS18360.1 hypothetical protein ALP71_03641 [Pseudomonas coronafaciens pv. garcae]RMU88206.1 hypothetical protein ALP20_102077 [Pseudomonas coronafaciens pv. coronafaciens]